MDIAKRVRRILKNANTLRISFGFPGINGDFVLVQGANLITVARSIKERNISIVEGVADPDKAIYTARNDGNRVANTMYIGPNDYGSTSFEALVVHEAIHALFDITRAVIPWIDNETAAYIAQGFYANNAGIPDEHVSRKEYVFLGKLMASDYAVTGQIDNLLLNDMRNKLRNDPEYAGHINQIFIGDG